MTRTIGVLSTDLMFSSKIQTAATGEAIDCQCVSRPDQLDGSTELVVIDLSTIRAIGNVMQELHDVLPQSVIVAVAPHVHTERLEEASQHDCLVLTRGQLHQRLQSGELFA